MRYRVNRTPHWGPIEHICIRCQAAIYCDTQPCYVPLNAPFFMCPPCIEASADEFAHACDQEAR